MQHRFNIYLVLQQDSQCQPGHPGRGPGTIRNIDGIHPVLAQEPRSFQGFGNIRAPGGHHLHQHHLFACMELPCQSRFLGSRHRVRKGLFRDGFDPDVNGMLDARLFHGQGIGHFGYVIGSGSATTSQHPHPFVNEAPGIY